MSPRSQLTSVRPKCGWCGALAGMALRARLRLAASSCSGDSAAARLRRAARLLGHAPFADAADQLGAGEIAVAVVDRGRGRAVGEIQEDRVRADRAAALVPVEGRGAHALHQPAADQPQDVDLVRALAVGDAAALRDVELGGPPRPRHPVGEVPGVDHADAAERAATPRSRACARSAGRSCANARPGARRRRARPPRPSPAPARRGSPSASRSARAFSRRRPARRARDAVRSASRCRPHRARRAAASTADRRCTAAPVSRGDGLAHLRGRFGDRHQLERRIAANRRQERPARGPHSDDPDADFAGHTWLLRAFVWSRLPRESKLRRKHAEQETDTMLTAEQNELLTRVGPGTPCGDLMRRYWHPIAAVSELEGHKWNKRVRLLGEDLVLFRDKQGRMRPDHRAVPAPPRLARLRHPDRRRHPLPLSRLGVRPQRPMPRASRTSRRRARSATRSRRRPIRSRRWAAMFWAYLGPAESKPLLPRIDGFVADGTIRMLGRALIPCNWLQIMENSLDPIHTEWLHGHTYEFVKEQKGQGHKVAISARHEKIAFREFEHGITKHRLLDRPLRGLRRLEDRPPGGVPEHPVGRQRRRESTRATTRSRSACRSTTPTRCTSGTPPMCRRRATRSRRSCSTRSTSMTCRTRTTNGEYIMDNIDGQDMMVWCTQGADRRPHQGEPRRLRQRHRALPPRAPPRDQEGRGRRRSDVHLPRRGARTRASTCRTSARSTTTATARGAGSCAPRRLFADRRGRDPDVRGAQASAAAAAGGRLSPSIA